MSMSSQELSLIWLKYKSNTKKYCLYTGIRLGEICALTWDDIDLENRRIEINKTIHRINERGKSYTIIGTPKNSTFSAFYTYTSTTLSFLIR